MKKSEQIKLASIGVDIHEAKKMSKALLFEVNTFTRTEKIFEIVKMLSTLEREIDELVSNEYSKKD